MTRIIGRLKAGRYQGDLTGRLGVLTCMLRIKKVLRETTLHRWRVVSGKPDNCFYSGQQEWEHIQTLSDLRFCCATSCAT